MVSFLKRFQATDSYDPWKLLDSKDYQDLYSNAGLEQIICDIDKTYLETNFESLTDLARIPFEQAEDKITVAGAAELLLQLRWGPQLQLSSNSIPTTECQHIPATGPHPRPLHFVSSSPPLLRKVLADKFCQDDLDWSSDTFKNQIYNIRAIRFDQLRQQILYKTAAILQRIYLAPANSQFLLIGDNAESDIYVYIGIKLYVEGLISTAAYAHYLALSGLDKTAIEKVLAKINQLRGISAHNSDSLRCEKRIKAIFIRNIKHYAHKFDFASILKTPIHFFDDFFDASLQLLAESYLEPASIHELVAVFHNRKRFALADLTARLQLCLKQIPSLQEGLASWLPELQARFPEPIEEGLYFLQHSAIKSYVRKDLDTFYALTEADYLAAAEAWWRKG